MRRGRSNKRVKSNRCSRRRSVYLSVPTLTEAKTLKEETEEEEDAKKRRRRKGRRRRK